MPKNKTPYEQAVERFMQQRNVYNRAEELWQSKSDPAARKLAEYEQYKQAGGQGLSAQATEQLNNKNFYTAETIEEYNPEHTFRSYLDQQAFLRKFRDEGVWDVEENTPSAWSESFLTTQIPALLKQYQDSQAADAEWATGPAMAEYEKLAKNAERWKQLYAEKDRGYSGETMGDGKPNTTNAPVEEAARWQNWLMADYLLGDQQELFDFDAINSRYEAMSDEEYYAEEARLQKQFDELDWEALMNPKMPTYESKTAELEKKYNDALKEQEARKAWNTYRGLAEKTPGTLDLEKYYAENIEGYDPQGYSADRMANLVYFINHQGGSGQQSNLMEKLNDSMIEDIVSDLTGMSLDDDARKVQSYYDKGYNFLLPDEIVVYNDLYHTDPKIAQGFLDSLEGELSKRKYMVKNAETEVLATSKELAVPMYGFARLAGIMDALMAPAKAAEALSGNDNYYGSTNDFGNMQQMVNAAQEAGLGEVEWANKLGTLGGKNILQHLYTGATSAVDNALRIGIGGKYGALALAGLGSTSSALQELSLRDDMSGAAKVVQAGLTGGLEVVTEKIGLDNLFRVDIPSASRYLINSMGAEIGEEVLNAIGQEGVEYVVSQIFGHEAEIKSAGERGTDLLNTIVQTAISSLLMGGGSAIAQAVDTRATGNSLKNQGDVEAVLSIAESMADGSEAKNAAEKIRTKQQAGKKVTNKDLGGLVKAVAFDIGAEHSGAVDSVLDEAVENRLVELGEDAANAKALAPVIREVTKGNQIKPKDRRAINWSEKASQVLKELNTVETEDAPAEWTQKAMRTAAEKARPIKAKQMQFREAMTTKTTTTTAVNRAHERARKLSQNKLKLAPEMVAFTDNADGRQKQGKYEKAVRKNGEFYVEVKVDGQKEPVAVPVKDLQGAGDEGLATILEYAAYESRHEMSPEEVNIMAGSYKQQGGDVRGFISQFEESYLSGYSGVKAPPTQMASELQKIAYEHGKEEAAKDEGSRVARARKARSNAAPKVSWLGDVASDTEVRGSGDEKALDEAVKGMTEGQHFVVDFAKQLSRNTGLNVVLFRSKEMDGGSLRTQNGSYDAATNTIYLDVNAGVNTKKELDQKKKEGTLGYAIMRTMGHEVTHAIEATSTEFYSQYKQAVKEELSAAGKDWAQLVRQKLDNAIRGGQKLTYAGAEAEVVADASEYMLQDSQFVQNMDAGMKNKVKRIMQDFIGKIRAAFKMLTGGHEESMALRTMRDGVMQYSERLQKLWDAGFVEMATAKVRESQIAEEGRPTQKQVRETAYDYSAPFAQQVDDWVDGKIPERDTLLLGRTPSVLREIGFSDLPMTIDQKHMRYMLGEPKNADHDLGIDIVKRLPELVSNPVAIIANPAPNKGNRAPGVMIIFAEKNENANGRRIVGAVSVLENGKINGITIDSTRLETAHSRGDVDKKIADAVQKERNGGYGVYYINKNALSLLEPSQSQVLGTLGHEGVIHSIREAPEFVNSKFMEQTDTVQFRKWFEGSKIVNEDGTAKVMYHGTPYGGFTVFKDWQYFTDNKEYADKYHNPSASSIRGRYDPATNPKTYEAYLSVKKPFDTRDPKIRKIWRDEFYGSYSGTPLSDRGLPDWTDGIDLIDFIEENDYDYDAIILDEGGVGGYGDEVQDRGISVVVRSSTQVKSATDNVGTFDTQNPDIRYSRRDATEQTETANEAYEKYKEASMRLNDIRKKQRELNDSDEMKTVYELMDKDAEAGAEAYKNLLESHGLNVNTRELQKQESELYRRWEELRDRELEAEEAAEIEKSGKTESEYRRDKAVKEFGYTPYFYDAGYIVPNGKMLNFSGEKNRHFGSRGQDHRAVSTVYANKTGSEAMVAFMHGGNIRIMPESPGLDIASSVEPTTQQYATIRKFVREYGDDEYLNIDFTNEKGNVVGNLEYEGRIYPDRVVNDIKHYFETGETREQGISAFMYSRRDTSDQTETGEFKRWFANSKVVNWDGTPKVMYHGSSEHFTAFDKSALKDKLGFFFTEDKREAQDYGKPRAFYLKIENPYDIWDGLDRFGKTSEEKVQGLKNAGYDGIESYSHGTTWYIAFEPTQIKSATDNVGTFDPQNPDIRYSRRDEAPDGVSIREFLGGMKPTDRMTETEKLLLKRYQENLRTLEEKEKLVAEQEEIIRTAPIKSDELTMAKNRYQIYRTQANRAARALMDAERSEGFARVMATSQEVVNRYLLGSSGAVADAADVLDEEIAGLTAQLKAVEADVTRTASGQRTAFARGLFDQKQLNEAAQKLKDTYGSRMSVKAIADRLALAYGEIYAENGAEGAKLFMAAARDLAEDMLRGNKFRYKSEILPMLAEQIGTISLTETDVQEIRNRGLTLSEYKRMLSPYIKVVQGGSDLSNYASNAAYYGEGALASVLGEDIEGNLAMRLYDVISREKDQEAEISYEGMSEGQLIAEAMADIAGANLPMSTDSKTVDYLRKELLKYAGENAQTAQKVEQAIMNAQAATRRASGVWRAAVQEVNTAKQAVEYYRKLEEQRRLTELKEQKQEITAQLRSDYAKKLEEKVQKQRTEYREREQKAREYRHSREELDKLRRRIGRNVKRLNTMRMRETDQRHVPQEFQHLANAVMQTFTDSSLAKLAFSPEKTASLARRYRLLQEVESDMTYYWDDEIEGEIENLVALSEAYTAIREREAGVPSYFSVEGVKLETEILTGVDNIVSNVLQMIDSANDAFLMNRNETFEAYATKTGEEIRKKQDYKQLKGWLGKAQKMLDENIRTGNMTPIYFMEHLNSPLLKEVFDEVRMGQSDYAKIVAQGKDFVQSAKEKYHYGAWVADGKLKMKTSQGHQIELTREEAAELYAIAKRESTNKLYQTEHLLGGGFQYKDITKKGEGLYAAKKESHSLDAADIDKISRWLTDEQKAYADTLVGFLSTTMADYGNAASMEMYGYKKFNEAYYIPFHTAAEQRFQRGDEGPQGENAGTGRLKNSGFTKKLQHGANATLVVGGLTDTVSEHIHKMATYAAMVQPIENMKRLMNHKVMENDGTVNTIRALIGQKYGQASQDYMAQLLKDLNGAAMGDERATDLVNSMIGAFKRGAVMASASVVLQQPTAMARAMAYISPKYFTQNPFYRPGKGTWDEMMKYAGTAVIKDMGKFDVGMGLTARQYIADEHLNAMEAYSRLKADSKWEAGKEAYKRALDWLTAAPGKADQWTWGLIWKAVKAEQAELHPGMDVNSEEFLQLCGDRFDDVIDHTQVYDSVITRSNLMRSKNALHRMATSFMSEPTLSINMLYDAFMGKHDKKQRGKILGGVIVSQVLAGAMAALAQAWNDDEDKRNVLERYADRATANILDNLNPLGMLPYVSDLMSLFMGYEVERPDMAAVADIIDYGKTFITKAADPEKTLTWKDYENFVGTIANMAGLPAKNISREVRRTWNLIMNSQWTAPDAFSVGQSMLENVPFYQSKNTAYYERIVAAELKGDTQKAEDYREYMLLSKMVSEESLRKGLKAAMQEAFIRGDADEDAAKQYLLKIGAYAEEDDAYWEVDKWKDMRDKGIAAGDYRKYADFFQAVETGENLRAVIKEYLDNGVSKTTLASQITTQYKQQLIDLKASGKGYADLQARILTAYEALGYDRAQKQKDIQKWFEKK